MMKVYSAEGKYDRLSISVNALEKSLVIHRLVARAFIPNPYNKVAVNHIDGNKRNNHVSNLEWVTLSENSKHAFDLGIAFPPNLPSGEKHPASKLNNIDVEMIRVLASHDFTYKQIAKRFGVHASHVSLIYRRLTRKNDNQ